MSDRETTDEMHQDPDDAALSQRARRIARAALVVTSLLVTIALGEVGLRLAAAVSPAIGSQLTDPLGILIEPYGEVGYRQKPGSVFRYPEREPVATANAAGYRGPLVSIPKPPGVIRVVLLGGSATHGWGVTDSETIDTYMREILETRDPGRTFEVVNLAFDAHDSWQMYERLRADGLPLGPDVVIMNAGVNDARNGRFPNLRDRDPRTLIWEGALHDLREGARLGRIPLWLRVKQNVYLARVPAFLRAVVARSARSEGLVTGPYPDALEYFERNLRRVAELTFSGRAALILSTEPSSLTLNYVPTDTSHRDYWIRDARTTQEYRDSLDTRMRRVQEELSAEGHPIRHVRATIPGEQFLDDAHLTAGGNRALAEIYSDEVISLLSER